MLAKEIDKKLLLVLIYLDRRRSYEDWVGLSLNDLISESGYKLYRGNNRIVNQFKSQIQFLIDNNLIKLKNKIPYYLTEYFAIKIVNDFNLQVGYVILTAYEIDTLLTIPFDAAKVFALYLYMKSFIFQKLRDKDSEFQSDYKTDDELKPSAFFSDVRRIPFETGLSNTFVNKCIQEFVSKGLFIKKEVGSHINSQGERVNVPNIYVENNEWAEEEIELTLKRYKHIYGTDKFEPLLKRKRR